MTCRFTKLNYWVLLRLCIFTVTVLLTTSVTLRAQTYGLRFVGQEDIQDSRTSLDLTPDKPICVNGDLIELAFDLSLAPNYETYFGYIFRIIQDDKRNLDLLYDQKARSFKLIIGEHFSSSVIKIDSAQLFYQWTRFRLQLDLKHNLLNVYTNNRLVSRDKLPFQASGCFRLFFGGNDFRAFKSKDLPPMRLRNIALLEDDQRTHYWPLNEAKGTYVKDDMTGQIASVKNPVWIKSLHTEWKLAEQFTLTGNASVAFDPSSETVNIIGSDRLYRCSIRNHQKVVSALKSPPPSLLPGNQAIYNPFSKKLYSYYVDQKAMSAYEPATQRWKNESLIPKYTVATEYWQANKFMASFDSSLYVLGGYGQLTYKNAIQRYRFRTHKWETLSAKGNAYTPRYLAALGTTSNTDTAYLIGGYGSLTGQQMLSPKSSYDLLQYLVKENTVRKLYELPVPKTDFAFANSLVIAPKSPFFYGLIFPNQQFKSHLQLIRGSLSKPTYEVLGNAIPYKFHDTHSYADLYFCPASHQLVAVTLYRNEKSLTTDVNLYTIAFPPNVLEPPSVSEPRVADAYWLWALAGLIAGGCVLLYFRRRHVTDRPTRELRPQAEPVPAKSPLVSSGELTSQPDLVTKPVPAPRASLFFFGNFQVVDHAGSDITKTFTPLLKELFLLLALNSIGKQRGVPSEKLSEILWPDKSDRDASNNRSVNIGKLRSILEKVGPCSLSKESGYWKVEFDFTKIHVDYERYMAIINDKATLTKQTIIELGEITKQGSFLLNTEYYWLDDFKADISNRIINTFLQYADKLTISDDPEFLIQLANFIFFYDPVNEDAIILKCKALALMGKHTLAKNAFERFAREYKMIYGDDYKQPFSAIID